MKNIRNIEEIRNIAISVVFLGMVVFGVCNTDVLYNLTSVVDVVIQNISHATTEESQEDAEYIANTQVSIEENSVSRQKLQLDDVNNYIYSLLPMQEEFISLSGCLMRLSGVRDFYNDEYGINVASNGYIIGQYAETTTDFEVEQMIELKQYLDERGIQLLYVNEPSKYIDDSVYRDEFGWESYLNRNMDLFLKRMNEAGIDYLDLRECITTDRLDCYDLFYRTDHHWTVPAAKWAASKIAKKMNENYGYDIDLNLYADENFSFVKYENCWIGEQGRKLAESYVGLDDYTMMKPLFDTSYCRWMSEAEAADWTGETYSEGNFDIFINYSAYEDGYNDVGEFQPAKMNGWHYSYNGNGFIQNNNADYGNVLIIGDSYERNLIPFLSLGVRNIVKVEPRYMGPGEVISVIDNGNYDTVVITYGQFMVGAHDNPENANYRAFCFFE